MKYKNKPWVLIIKKNNNNNNLGKNLCWVNFMITAGIISTLSVCSLHRIFAGTYFFFSADSGGAKLGLNRLPQVGIGVDGSDRKKTTAGRKKKNIVKQVGGKGKKIDINRIRMEKTWEVKRYKKKRKRKMRRKRKQSIEKGNRIQKKTRTDCEANI